MAHAKTQSRHNTIMITDSFTIPKKTSFHQIVQRNIEIPVFHINNYHVLDINQLFTHDQ